MKEHQEFLWSDTADKNDHILQYIENRVVNSFNVLYYSPCEARNKLKPNPCPCFKRPEILMPYEPQAFWWDNGCLHEYSSIQHCVFISVSAFFTCFKSISHSPLFPREQMQCQLAYLLGPFKRKTASFLVTCHLFCFSVQSLNSQCCGTQSTSPRFPGVDLQ